MPPIGAPRNMRPRATAARMAAAPTSSARTNSSALRLSDATSATGLSRRPRRERKKALLVGVARNEEDVDSSEALRAHLDVEKIRKVLLNHCGYREKDIVVMLDRQDSRKDLRPTQQNIERRLKRLTRKAEAGDKFFFFYAGHGEQRPCLSESESDGFDEFITCERGQAIKDNRLRELLVDRLPAGAQLFALFDTCHAGTMLDLPHTARARVFSIFFVVGRLRRIVAAVRVRITAATAASGLPIRRSREVKVEVEVVQTGMEAMGVEVEVEVSATSPRHSTSVHRHCRHRRSSSATSSTTSTSTIGSDAPRPMVLALSSTADNEESWESPEGGPFASAFASVLTTCAASGTITPRKLLREFQRVLAAKYVERLATLDAWLEQCLRHAAAARGAGRVICEGEEDEMREMVERAKKAQRPQLSSLTPSDMDRPLSL